MGKGALRPFFKGHSLKKEKEHEKKEVDKMLSHFVTLPTRIPAMRKGIQSIPREWNGNIANTVSIGPRGILAVSRPVTRAGTKVNAVEETQTHRRPPKRLCVKVRIILETTRGYKNMSTGMAAAIIVFKPTVATTKERIVKIVA